MEYQYKGHRLPSFKDLVDYWNDRQPPILQRKYSAALAALRRWRRANPVSALTDEAIEKVLTPRGATDPIWFRGHAYKSVADLVRAWNDENPAVFQANPRTVADNLRKWRKKNADNALTDAIIECALTPRAARHALQYRGVWYSGPTAVHRAMGERAELNFKAFFRNYSRWRAKHPYQLPADAELESLAKRTLHPTDDGRNVGPLRLRYEKLPEPKLGWGRVYQKIQQFRQVRGREPDEDDVLFLATPEEWMVRPDDPAYLSPSGRVLTVEEIYNRVEGEKCTLGAFKKRIFVFKTRMGTKPTLRDLKQLVQSWGEVHVTSGLLYRWTHRESGRVYTGITTQTLDERTRNHVREAESGEFRNGSLQEAIARDGQDAFEIEELGQFDDLDELVAAERDAIVAYNSLSPKGYNLDAGGGGVSLRTAPLEIAGTRYRNLAAVADAFGIPLDRLVGRIHRLHWPLEEAVIFAGPMARKRDNPHGLRADESIPILAERHGIKAGTVYGRLALGWSLDEALGIAPRAKEQTEAC